MSDSSEEWGPLVLHDGKGCPVTGMFCEVHAANGAIATGIVRDDGKHPCSLWTWAQLCLICQFQRVVAYRVRKPRALLDMIERAKEIEGPPLKGPARIPENVET